VFGQCFPRAIGKEPFQQTILMCPPDHFEVAYAINPWMERNFPNTNDALAHPQWNDLRNAAWENLVFGAVQTAASTNGQVSSKSALRAAGEPSLRQALRDFIDKAQASGADTVALVYLAISYDYASESYSRQNGIQLSLERA
jgi:hypothetical protein